MVFNLCPNAAISKAETMRKILIVLLAAVALALCIAPLHAGPGTWLRKARIAGPDIWYGMSDKQLRGAIDELAEQGVNAVDVDFSSESIERQLEMVGRILSYARSAHPKMRFFVYQAPLESVSYDVDKNRDGKVDAGKTSTYSEHPEWAQRGLNGDPALFYGADANAFWVGKSDEDVWLCPNDPEYKLVWKDHLRRLAVAGVDAIYIDVPFLRGWFDEKRDWGFACACSDCAAIYKSQYGADLPAKNRLERRQLPPLRALPFRADRRIHRRGTRGGARGQPQGPPDYRALGRHHRLPGERLRPGDDRRRPATRAATSGPTRPRVATTATPGLRISSAT